MSIGHFKDNKKHILIGADSNMKKFIIKILLGLFISIASILLFDKWIWITINLVLLVVYANNWLKEEF